MADKKIGAQKYVKVNPTSNVAKRLKQQQSIMDATSGRKETVKTVADTDCKRTTKGGGCFIGASRK